MVNLFLLEVANRCDFYNQGFFGYGEKGNFKYFSLAHIIPIILLVAAIILTYIYREKLRNWKHEKSFRLFIGVIMMLAEMGYFWRLLYCGSGSADSTTLLTKLPFQVCEWTGLLGMIMVWAENKTCFDIDVFVCLTTGIVPLITPAVISTTGPRYFRYYQFFFEHEMTIYAVFYMMFVKGYKFNPKKIYKPIIFMSILCVFAIIFNTLIDGAQYLYLSGKKDGGAISNLLPQSIPLRLLIMGAITLAGYALEILLFKLVEKIKNKKIQTAEV